MKKWCLYLPLQLFAGDAANVYVIFRVCPPLQGFPETGDLLAMSAPHTLLVDVLVLRHYTQVFWMDCSVAAKEDPGADLHVQWNSSTAVLKIVLAQAKLSDWTLPARSHSFPDSRAEAPSLIYHEIMCHKTSGANLPISQSGLSGNSCKFDLFRRERGAQKNEGRFVVVPSIRLSL